MYRYPLEYQWGEEMGYKTWEYERMKFLTAKAHMGVKYDQEQLLEAVEGITEAECYSEKEDEGMPVITPSEKTPITPPVPPPHPPKTQSMLFLFLT